jgi:hypothetical protein
MATRSKQNEVIHMPNPKPLKTAPKAVNGIVWGAAAIGAIVGMTPGQVYFHVAKGHFGDAVRRFSPRKLYGFEEELRRLRVSDPTTTVA